MRVGERPVSTGRGFRHASLGRSLLSNADVTGQARVLLICDDRSGLPNTVLDHIDAFRRYSHHDIRTFNTRGMARSIALDLDHFDVVVIHYSVVISSPQYFPPDFYAKLKRFRGLKIEFIQDDYRWVDRETAASRDIGINVLFTVAPEPAAGQLYDERLPGVRRVQTLTGYVPDNLRDRPLRPLDERPVDVGYRARDLPFWLGRLAREKAWIGQRFLELAPAYGLRCDIAWTEHDRIYGDRWVEFVSSCRATLGTESGASIADFDGSVEAAVLTYLNAHPAASYEQVHDAVLQPYEGNVVIKVISPRIFEAASLGTAMVLFPGDYSGVVRRDEHYIGLEKDFSNMDEVVHKLRDDTFIAAMTKRTLDHLINSGRWSYQAFITQFDQVVDEEASTKRGPSTALRYRMAKAERAIKVPPLRIRVFRAGHAAWQRVFNRDASLRFAIDRESQIEKGIFALRSALWDRDLRGLLRLGRRTGAPLDRLLREILELSLLRKAAIGRLPGEPFGLSVEFDPARKSIYLVSIPPGAPGGTRGGGDREAGRDAVRTGELRAIEWDHRALGGLVHLFRPPMDVGVGFEGLENFTVLAGIGRDHPAVLERALGPVLSVPEPVAPSAD